MTQPSHPLSLSHDEMGRVVMGCDFSSAPSRRKPIVLAWGHWNGGLQVQLDRLEHCATLAQWEQVLSSKDTAWVGGFDLPFGLPRALVESLGWPADWADCMAHYAQLSRDEIREQFAAYCAARSAGRKMAHRAADGPAGSSPSMKWVNPPVAFMLHAGVPRLRAAQVHLPGIERGDVRRLALEAYPGWIARQVLGRQSYKSDTRSRQDAARAQARVQLLQALERGESSLGLQLRMNDAQREAILADAQGDALDACICMLQAAWGARAHAQGDALYGLPPELDPLEGWIVSVPWPKEAGNAGA